MGVDSSVSWLSGIRLYVVVYKKYVFKVRNGLGDEFRVGERDDMYISGRYKSG